MTEARGGNDVASVLRRLDRRSTEAFMHSLAEEFARLYRIIGRLEARLATMETLNAVADRLLSEGERDVVPLPSNLKVNAADSFPKSAGFYGLEYDEKGRAFRWTGPDRNFWLQLFVDRGAPASFALSFLDFFSNDPIDRLRAFVDGDEVPLSFRRNAEGYEAIGPLPIRSDAGGTVLTFVIPSVVSPAAKVRPDSRMLGLRFLGLSVEPLAAGVAAGLARLAGATMSRSDEVDEREDSGQRGRATPASE